LPAAADAKSQASKSAKTVFAAARSHSRLGRLQRVVPTSKTAIVQSANPGLYCLRSIFTPTVRSALVIPPGQWVNTDRIFRAISYLRPGVRLWRMPAKED